MNQVQPRIPDPNDALEMKSPDMSLYTMDDVLVPSYSSQRRKSNMVVATFNLVATIVGGGVLSIPLSFEKAGIIPATGMMIFAAIITDFSLYLLCSCSRRTGAQTYGELCLVAFGKGFELFSSFLLFVFLMFVIVAYMVLIQNIWTPLVHEFVLIPLQSSFSQLTGHGYEAGKQEISATTGNVTLLVLVVLMAPFLFRKDLHALRYNCYVGFSSITVLCLAIVYRAYQKCSMIMIEGFEDKNDEGTMESNKILWKTDEFADLLFAFPIIMLSFLCAFNIIPVQAALIQPTRKRVRYVIDLSIFACFVLMYTFGLAGYLFARSQTKGDILLNFQVGDNLIILGRIGSGLTILMALPMMTLPCRQSILEFLPNFKNWLLECFKERERINNPDDADIEVMNEKTSLVTKHKGSTSTDETDDVPNCKDSDHSNGNQAFIEFTATVIIISVCYTFAISVPGVAIVWSICGSSMAFLIAFIIPCASYIKIRQYQAKIPWYNSKVICAWLLLIFSTLGAIACTVQTVWRILYSTE